MTCAMFSNAAVIRCSACLYTADPPLAAIKKSHL